jgi:hypothetical protein
MAHTVSATFGKSTPRCTKELAVSGIALVLVTTALVVVFALLAATAAGKLARLDGATYPTALTRAAAAFAAVFTLAAALIGALAQLHI